jgi:NADH-quinone oxidoreductase subunit G
MGTVSSIEEVFFFLQFLKNSGYSNFLINNYIYKLNFDLPLFYQFNSKFIEIEYSDLILLIGCNIRTDSSLLNLKIRKQFFNKESLIGFFGSFFNALFPYIHLGTSTKQFFQLIEGRHFFCKKLRAAQKPLLICGAEFGFRNDSKSCQNVIKFLAKKLSSNLKNLNSLNILHQNLSQIHFCELGFNLQANNFLYNMELNKNFLFNLENNNLFFLNNIDFSSEIFPKLLKNKFCSLNSHNYEWISDTMQNFPIKTLFEKNSLIINTEGRIQKISQTITSINSTRDSTEFFISLLKLQQTKNKFKNFLKNLYIENPFLKNNFKTRSLFYFNFLNLYEISNKIIFSPLINSIHNFYMTDNISQNSKTMAECTLFLKIKKNFLK